MVTGGPPSVAILVEAMSVSAAAGGRCACSGAAAGQRASRRLQGWRSSRPAATGLGCLVGGRDLGCRRRRAGIRLARPVGFGWSGGDFRDRDLRAWPVSAAMDSAGGSAAVRLAPRARRLIEAGSARCGSRLAADRGPWLSRVFPARWLDAQHRQHRRCGFGLLRKLVSGAACHDGVLANSSWAARSSAAAPSPKTSIDIDNTIAANRKRKPGSMDAEFRLREDIAGYLQRPLSRRERGDDRTGRVRDAAGTAGAQRIRLIQGYRNGLPAFVKNRRREWPLPHVESAFPGR